MLSYTDSSSIHLAYACYLAISVALTIWVARALSSTGETFLIRCFGQNRELARSTNHLLVIGCLPSTSASSVIASASGHPASGTSPPKSRRGSASPAGARRHAFLQHGDDRAHGSHRQRLARRTGPDVGRARFTGPGRLAHAAALAPPLNSNEAPSIRRALGGAA
ncbi:MAG: hypothetical protein IPP28_06745 [Xanthomonadales bacterium]|nr:hypothetical protein [Xanthomonadales bacterium]